MNDWNINKVMAIIDDGIEGFMVSSGVRPDRLAISEVTVVLMGFGNCNRICGLDIEIHDDLPNGEFYLLA